MSRVAKLLKLVRINRRESKNSQQVPLHHLNQGGTYRKELIFKFSIARNFFVLKMNSICTQYDLKRHFSSKFLHLHN